jgi:hypothetical protein
VVDGAAQQPALDRKPDLEIVGLDTIGAAAASAAAAAPSARPRAACLRVGMLRRGEDSARRPLLDDLRPASRRRVGDAPHDAEIVGDEQHRHAELGCSSFSSSRICACMVTSSAVVGSSAISRSGSLASAMAIITRWRWPPDSWCG